MENKSENKTCQNCRENFTFEQNEQSFYEKMEVSIPNFCSDCRNQRRLAWRNERCLYHRDCTKCGVKLISIYSKEKPFPVFCNKCWFGDEWDPMDYQIEYDSSKDFLVQYNELLDKIPHLGIPNFKNVNSEYGSWLDECKNCYLTFGSSRCEDVLFSETLQDCKFSLDLTACDSLEYSYNSIYCHNSNKLQFCVDCDACIECYFSFDLKGCQNCFLSYNLRHKNYQILNQQYSKEEWKEKIEKILGDRKLLKESLEKFRELKKNKAIHRFSDIQKSFFTTGNNILESKNSSCCFDSKRIEDSRFLTNAGFSKDSADIYGVMRSELCYEGVSISQSSNCRSILYCGDGVNVNYSQYTVGCQNVFGCDSLRKKSFCVLNKQYREEEYKKITTEIISKIKKDNKYGEFLSIKISPYGYNETMANIYFPLKKEEIEKNGYKWQENTGGIFGKATITAKELPENIQKTNDSISNEIIECLNCKKNYKIIEKELNLYNKLNISIPEKCVDCRFKERLEFYLPRKLWHRQCMKDGCTNTFETSYAPERSEIVYCERCYQQEVY